MTGKPTQIPNSSPLAPASSGPGNISGVRHAETAMNTNGAAGPSESAQSRTSRTVWRISPGVGLTTSRTIATATATAQPPARRRARAARRAPAQRPA